MDIKMTEKQKQLVYENLRLANYVTNKHSKPYDNIYEDLTQEAYLALCIAAQRFDASRGFEFTSFAFSYIDGYIRKYKKQELYHGIKFPRSISELYSRLKTIENYEELSDDEIKDILQIDNKKLALLKISNSLVSSSIDEPISSNNDSDNSLRLIDKIDLNMSNNLDNNSKQNLEDEYIQDLCFKLIDNFMLYHSSRTNNKNIRIILENHLFSSLYDERHEGQREISKKSNVSQSYVSRILSKFKKESRDYLNKMMIGEIL